MEHTPEEEAAREREAMIGDLLTEEEKARIFAVNTLIRETDVAAALAAGKTIDRLGLPFIDSPELAEAAKKALYDLEEALTVMPGIENIPPEFLRKYIYYVIMGAAREYNPENFNREMDTYLKVIQKRDLQLRFSEPEEKFSWEMVSGVIRIPEIQSARLAEIRHEPGSHGLNDVAVRIFKCEDERSIKLCYSRSSTEGGHHLLKKGSY